MANEHQIRNLAIIAHVDHGKTTLIDGLFRQAGVFEAHEALEDRVMDSGDLEKERGITITAKNAAFNWKGIRINIVDTPGHADFGGEVERALFMVDGALLLVDAAEGPLPQTRFVLRKALERGIKIIVVINKVDRPDSRIEEVEEHVLELFYDLALDDAHVDYPVIYASAKQGWASLEKGVEKKDFSDLLDLIIKKIPPPRVTLGAPFKMLVTNRTFSPFLGLVAIGRVESGSVKEGQRVSLIQEGGKVKSFAVTSLETYSGLGTERVTELQAGDIALLSGADEIRIGDTICELECREALPRIKVDPPTVSMRVSVNTSPFAGKEGDYLTSRKLEEQLSRACTSNVALGLEATDTSEVFLLKGRGELQMVVLFEELRRKGYEFMIGRPEIIPIEKDGQLFEPLELLVADVPEEFVGTVTELLSRRGGRMESMEKLEASSRVRMEFLIPSRGLIGIRSQLLTETRGEAIFASTFKDYIPFQGKRLSRANGAIVCDRNGSTTQYALFHLQDRGKLFIRDGVSVYEGMVIGEHSRNNDLNANPTKPKKLSNMRASGKDESTKLDAFRDMSFDEVLEWIDEDEWIEITPKSIRIRKAALSAQNRSVIRSL